MSGREDLIARHEGFYKAARGAWERAADGPEKDMAGRHLLWAEVAAMNSNEVDFLLETHRARRALRDHPPDNVAFRRGTSRAQ